jgi:peptide/nickel transport system substrate-binding protein
MKLASLIHEFRQNCFEYWMALLFTRKLLFDRVQEIVRQQEPFIYLVHKNALAAVSRRVRGADPVVLSPHTYWQIERMSLSTEQASR